MIGRQSVQLRVTGRVQGVGFRYFVQRTAEALGLAGEVRNLRDGSVEVEAEGERAALESLVEAVRRGPAGARVSEVGERWGEASGRRAGFRIAH